MKVFLLLFWLLGGAVRAQAFSEEVVRATHKLFNEKSTATGFVLAAMGLEGPAGSGVKPLPIAVLADDPAAASAGFTVGSNVLVLGFSTRFEVAKLGFPVCRRGCIASFPVVPIDQNPTMIIDYSTFEGDSGDQSLCVGPATLANRCWWAWWCRSSGIPRTW
jgi:hypothetical protein